MSLHPYPKGFFCGRRPLPFGGSHLRLPSGPAGIRTTTGSLSALARPTPYQLSHRVAFHPYPKGAPTGCQISILGESRVRGVGIFAVLDQLSYLGLTGKFGIWTGDTSGRKVACSNFMVFDDDRDEIKLDETFSHLDSEVGHVNKYL